MKKQWVQGFDRVETDRVAKTTSDRRFGVTVGLAFLFLGILTSKPLIKFIFLALGGLLLAFGVAAPQHLKTPKSLWFKLAGVLHRVVNPVIMICLFFLIITPLACILRIFRRDALGIRKDKDKSSFWELRPQPPENAKNAFKYQF